MAFEFKIKIAGSEKPPIWRKVKVNETISFDSFHDVIQTIFDWADYHLYLYSPSGWGSYPMIQADPEDDEFREDPVSPATKFPDGRLFDAKKLKLNQYFSAEKQKVKYIYDFGDDWLHEIELVKISDDKVIKPICTGGKGQAPIEDCGGIWGYYSMVETVNDPKSEEYEGMREWVGLADGELWDVKEFDIEEINDRF